MKILLVDDIDDFRENLAEVLEIEGYCVKTAANGSEALEIIPGFDPDIVITDLLMPEMDGYELCRHIKTDDRLKHITVVFFSTAYGDDDDKGMAEDLGASGYIEKSGSMDSFLASVRDVINHAQSPQGRKHRARKARIELEHKNRALEEALENSRILKIAIEHAGDAVMIFNKKGVLEYINPSASRITGVKCIDGKGPCQCCSVCSIIWGLIGEKKFQQSSIDYLHKDGREFSGHVSISEVSGEDGEISCYIAILRDMTDYKALESELHQAQKMEAVGTLVGGIAHDFNNTLGGIVGNVYLGQRSLAMKESREIVKERFKSIESLSYSAAGMVKQLLAFSRRGSLEMKTASLKTFLKEMIKLAGVGIPENIKFTHMLCEDELQINGDMNLIQQVIMNLVNNAIHAVKNRENPEIQIKLDRFEPDAAFLQLHPGSPKEPCALITVADNGTGIPEEDLHHIFDPFFTTKGVNEGTGLGLSMVQSSIKSHNGYVHINTEEGAGTEFHILLPISADKKISERPRLEIISSIIGRGETILLADDNEIMLSTTKKSLEVLGYSVVDARNGSEMIEAFEQYQDKIALVISDVVMPLMNGYDAVKVMRKMNPDLPVIYMTGYAPGEIEEIKTDGKTELLIKPVPIPLLGEKVHQLIEKQREVLAHAVDKKCYKVKEGERRAFSGLASINPLNRVAR